MGYPGNSNDLIGAIDWATHYVSLEVNEAAFELKFAQPLIFSTPGQGGDHLIFMEWNGMRLLCGKSRWNKLFNMGEMQRTTLHNAFDDWKLGGVVTVSKWDSVWRHYVRPYESEWAHVRNALAYIVNRKRRAASQIQKAWRKCICNPKYRVTKKRLKREVHGLGQI